MIIYRIRVEYLSITNLISFTAMSYRFCDVLRSRASPVMRDDDAKFP